MKLSGVLLLIPLLNLAILQFPLLAIDRIEIIRLCRKARNYSNCMRELDGVRFDKSAPTEPNQSPIKIRVIPYRG